MLNKTYTAHDIEVLEGLEPVRKRPAMYIGGIDSNSMHHLVTEILDNSMDEVVAGYAVNITMELFQDGKIAISDNGRGIPVDNHPKFPNKSALEVILTTLHSGGKFSNKIYETSGGLHGVGLSVVNALSSHLIIEVARDGNLYTQEYKLGHAVSKLTKEKLKKKYSGTKITFLPDAQIFGASAKLIPHKIYELAKAKAYLHKGVTIFWKCDESLLQNTNVPAENTIHFPNGLADYLSSNLETSSIIGNATFSGNADLKSEKIKIQWAICWHQESHFIKSYCNTIPTPLGGTHEQGMRAALLKAIKSYCEMIGHKKIPHIIADDIIESACIMLSIFIKEPVFQGQTKEKLVSHGITKHLETTIKDHFEHWLIANRTAANLLIENFLINADYRLKRKNERNVTRKNIMQKLQLPVKLADCTSKSIEDTELFIVEGDSAGGSAKQARDRITQAVLPLRGKILNVANANFQKIAANQEIQDLKLTLNCGVNNDYQEKKLRYGKIIIMADADVDGAHITSLIMTFFYIYMRPLIENKHLYLSKPPLYRILYDKIHYYAYDDHQKNLMLEKFSAKNKKIEVGRFKGLGEMTAKQLKDTTMHPKTRTLYQVNIDDFENVDRIVSDLMGKKPEKRFEFIQNRMMNHNKKDENLYIQI